MDGSEINKSASLPSPTILRCPKCTSNIRITGFLQTKYVACGQCDHLFSYPDTKPIKLFKKKKRPSIPLGSTGNIDGKKYEVTGFINYREPHTPYSWDEYILFNPIHGYSFLSMYEGHWNYFEQILIRPVENRNELRFQGNKFRLFNKYKQKAEYAIGEVHWDISKETSTITEYILPPNIIVHDLDKTEEAWFLGRYIEPKEIKEIFKLETKLPNKNGVGSTQIHHSSADISSIKSLTLYSALLITALQIHFSFLAKDKVLLDQEFYISDSSARVGIVSPPFKLEKNLLGKSNLQFDLIAPVSNSWLETDITMVNDQTGEEFQFEIGVEYYSGYEGGESWSEGQNYTDKTLSEIPDGTYHLNIFPAHAEAPGLNYFKLTVTNDVSMLSNYFIILILALIYPLYLWFSTYSFEVKRWMNSDYSPYYNE